MTCIHHELSRGGTTLPPRTEAAGFTGVKQQQRERGAAQKRLLTSGGAGAVAACTGNGKDKTRDLSRRCSGLLTKGTTS